MSRPGAAMEQAAQGEPARGPDVPDGDVAVTRGDDGDEPHRRPLCAEHRLVGSASVSLSEQGALL